MNASDPPPTDTQSTLENTATDPGKRLIELLLKVVTALVSVAGVAVVGQAVAWTRFEAAELPANQAITYLGQDERVSIGGLTLAAFVVAAAVAVAIVFSLDRQADPEKRVTRWGLIALMVAGVIGGALMSLGGRWEFWVTAGLVLATVAVIWYRTKDLEAKNSLTQKEKRELWLWRLAPIAALALLLVVPGIINGDEAWFPLLYLGTALLLGGIAFGIAKRTGSIFRWYGLAVFLSVVLFGGVVTVARTFNAPKVQSVAVLVQDGATVKAVSGIYVADNDKRVYVGSVELDGDEVKENSGAIFWIPCERVLTYTVGALQSTPVALDRGTTLAEELESSQPAGTPEAAADEADEAAASEATEAETEEEEPGGSCAS